VIPQDFGQIGSPTQPGLVFADGAFKHLDWAPDTAHPDRNSFLKASVYLQLQPVDVSSCCFLDSDRRRLMCLLSLNFISFLPFPSFHPLMGIAVRSQCLADV
jgi:hypothetical protein